MDNKTNDYDSDLPSNIGKEEKEPEVEKKSSDIHISKKVIFIILTSLGVLLIVLLLWQTKVLSTIYQAIMPASAQVSVLDNTTKKPITAASTTIGQTSLITGETGLAQFSKLRAGKTHLKVTAAGYFNQEKDIKLKRGKNELTIYLELNIKKITWNAKVIDFASREPIEAAKVETKFGSANSGKDGKVSINNVATGENEITISRDGYLDKIQKLTINEQLAELTLTPTGKVVFVSNRDQGKRAIYVCNYDGSDLKQLIKREGDAEDYNAILSPDQSKVIFFSTRDQRKSKYSGFEPSLFVINVNGSNLNQLSDGYGISQATWASDSKRAAWTARSGVDDTATNLYSLEIGNDPEKLNDDGTVGSFDLNKKATAIVWSQSVPSGNPTAKKGIFYKSFGESEIKKINDNSGTPKFSSDDSEILFSYYDQTENKTKFNKYNISDGSSSEYTPESTDNKTEVVSPDKKRVAYVSNRDGKSDIYIKDVDGKNEKKITNLGTVTGNPMWSKNSKYLIFDSQKTAETARYIVGLNAAEPQKITDIYLDRGM